MKVLQYVRAIRSHNTRKCSLWDHLKRLIDQCHKVVIRQWLRMQKKQLVEVVFRDRPDSLCTISELNKGDVSARRLLPYTRAAVIGTYLDGVKRT